MIKRRQFIAGHQGPTGALAAFRKGFQVGINNAATPAPPSAPTANTNMAITALASRLYLLWTLDMASSLITIRVPPSTDRRVHNAPIVTLCMMQIT